MEGLDQIRKAARSLRNRRQPLREQVSDAARQFWAAYYYCDHWPQSLQDQAEDVLRCILAKGRLEHTLALMNEQDLRQAARELASFCEAAEQVLSSYE